MKRRTQGRPARGEGDVGREGLLVSTRELLRLPLRGEIQRQQIATSAEITPALVNYYYPEKNQLVREAAEPVIEEYVDKLRLAINSDCSPEIKIRSLIRVYINFSATEGYLLDHYMEHCLSQSRPSLIEAAYRDVFLFMRDLVDRSIIVRYDPQLILSALWGSCKHAAQQITLMNSDDPRRKQRIEAATVGIGDIFLRGLLANTDAASESGSSRSGAQNARREEIPFDARARPGEPREQRVHR